MSASEHPEDMPVPFLEGRESPRHGFRGDRPMPEGSLVPASLTVAVSREAGSRGTSIAGRAGQKLGWQKWAMWKDVILLLNTTAQTISSIACLC